MNDERLDEIKLRHEMERRHVAAEETRYSPDAAKAMWADIGELLDEVKRLRRQDESMAMRGIRIKDFDMTIQGERIAITATRDAGGQPLVAEPVTPFSPKDWCASLRGQSRPNPPAPPPGLLEFTGDPARGCEVPRTKTEYVIRYNPLPGEPISETSWRDMGTGLTQRIDLARRFHNHDTAVQWSICSFPGFSGGVVEAAP